MRRVATLLLVSVLVCTLGCGGCNSEDSADAGAESEDENKKKDDLELTPTRPLLDPGLVAEEGAEDDRPRVLVKPGHWMVVAQRMKANYDDFVGETSARVLTGDEAPVLLPQTDFSLRSQRPVVLSKGRPKRIETEVFVPNAIGKGALVSSALRRRGAGRELAESTAALQRMPSYQYFVLVLADSPDEYAFLKVTDTVRGPYEDDDNPYDQYYHVVLAGSAKGGLPVPENPLAMSSVAYVVWDRLDPERLTPRQQDSLVDWLHWGGRLIVSGPGSLDLLRGSFLEGYLSASGDATTELKEADLSELNLFWGNRLRGMRREPTNALSPWPAVRLKPSEAAVPMIGTGGLVVEHPVGRGSVVTTAFRLTQREFLNWKGFDGFLNGALFRRPARRFARGPYGGLRAEWAHLSEYRLDSHLATPVRLFSRDSGSEANVLVDLEYDSITFGGAANPPVATVDRLEGVAGWTGFSPVAEAARSVLREAAGVTVPGSGFVVACLAAYLLVLVPLNWAIFYTLGRVEWAWLAAPVIAVVGTVVVVQQAQLDIGFVRSQNEVAVLELYGGHDRGRLSRYAAFYTSLSTTYDLTYDDPRALALPFSTQSRGEQTSRTISDRVFPVVSEKTNESELRGLTVPSAATTMMHAEEIAELEGPVRLGVSSRGHRQLENRSELRLRDAAIVEFTPSTEGPPTYRGCWLGDVQPGESVLINTTPLAMSRESLDEGGVPFTDERRSAAELLDEPPFDIGPVLLEAFRFAGKEDPAYAQRSETRLVAVLDETPAGPTVSPRASQLNGMTVVVTHLAMGLGPDPRPDVNSRQDIPIDTPYEE
ncbi:MAG: hypothetical protein AAGA92_02000 [Planctomycetota bacterium]